MVHLPAEISLVAILIILLKPTCKKPAKPEQAGCA